MKPVGLDWNINQAPAQTHTSRMTIYLDPLILRRTPSVYFPVTLSNHSLNLVNHLVRPLFFLLSSVGLSSNVQSAGVNERAMKADIITEMAMVMANCWYNLPTMPGINPTGTKTAARINAMATTGAEISFIAWYVASLGDIFSWSM